MDEAPGPRLPLPLRALNGLGRWTGLPRIALDADRLMARAARATGLDDFGDPGFRPGLETLLESLDGEAALTAFGRVVARGDLQRVLENRLHMQAAWRAHPEIAAGEVRAPVFIAGAPRTGTSILHELLAQDPAVRVPLTWEVMYVWPPPERASRDGDPRIARVAKHYAQLDRLMPDFKRMHPMGAELPQECAVVTAHDFASMVWPTQFRVSGYQTWFESADHEWMYRGHKRQLQYLQWRCPGSPWVLKSPQHLWTLEALFAVYPDARVIQTHRDPLKIVASLTSLCAELRGLTSDAIHPREIGEEWAERLAEGLRRTHAAREAGRVPPGSLIDLHFHEFMRDPIEAVRKLYVQLGMTLDARAEDAMRAFLAANPRDKHGRHRYRLADAGLDEARERERFAFYQEAYGVPSEPVD